MQNNFLIYHKVYSVRFTAKTWNFVYSCRILFSFKQFLFHNFMLYWAEKNLFLWRDAISRFKCPKYSGRQGTYWHL